MSLHAEATSSSNHDALCLRRTDVEAKGVQLTELSTSKASLEQELAVLTESHGALTQQHEALQQDLARGQAALNVSEEAKAAAEVCTACCIVWHRNAYLKCAE